MYMDGIMSLELGGYVPIKIYLKKLEENFSMQEILTALWKDVAGIKALPPKQQQRWPVILYICRARERGLFCGLV